MGQKVLWADFRKQLNGRIVSVIGNHDRKKELMVQIGMDEVHDDLTIEINGFKVFMRHIPSRNPAKFGCDYMLVGHVHSQWSNQGAMINVGVDVRGYMPRSFEELIEGIPPRVFPDLESVRLVSTTEKDDYLDD